MTGPETFDPTSPEGQREDRVFEIPDCSGIVCEVKPLHEVEVPGLDGRRFLFEVLDCCVTVEVSGSARPQYDTEERPFYPGELLPRPDGLFAIPVKGRGAVGAICLLLAEREVPTEPLTLGVGSGGRTVILGGSFLGQLEP